MPSANRKKFAFEVKEYLDFVNQFGLEGGWETGDHSLFLKVRTKIKEPQKTAKYLNSLMPDKSIEVILEHENWYQKYLNLKEKQRNVIKQWRCQTAPTVAGKNDLKPTLNIYHKEEYNREKNIQRISKWKDEKQKLLINKEMENQKNVELQKQIEEKRKLQYKEKKEKVAVWKIEKKRKHLEEKLRNELLKNIEKEQKSTEALKAIKLFQSKDDEFIEKMKKKRTKQAKSTIGLIRGKISAPRDPERLFKPTKQWMQRSKRKEIRKGAVITFPMDIKQVPKLCLPMWRKGVPLLH
ncbi:coiled-coil domain-containing protein 112-like [Agrilus planipennis]|uniref:Coiled-coil domain-containing protein 112-like n=1 Tax=Agrilus planipennis TaxID=224129 RepID=A0A7F5RFM5_AGRPL|nr:coiled-coil domain-containing protein 112-like [Agrilus planipennis]